MLLVMYVQVLDGDKDLSDSWVRPEASDLRDPVRGVPDATGLKKVEKLASRNCSKKTEARKMHTVTIIFPALFWNRVAADHSACMSVKDTLRQKSLVKLTGRRARWLLMRRGPQAGPGAAESSGEGVQWV